MFGESSFKCKTVSKHMKTLELKLVQIKNILMKFIMIKLGISEYDNNNNNNNNNYYYYELI